jgi:dTDP-L-rhamnose 4-epimerase
LPTTEDSLIHPLSIYGITKQGQEQMVMLTGKSLDIPSVSFRYQNVYGLGQSLANPYTGILSIFSNLIKSNKNIQIFEDGDESRDFVYIDDVVKATILGLESKHADGEIFNVGTGNAVSVLEIAKLLIANYQADVDIKITGSYRIGDIRHNFADINKIKSKLGFNPEFDIEKGIKLFCEWVEQNKIGDINFEKSIEEMKNKGLFKSTTK